MFKVIIADDEKPARDRLKKLLFKYPEFQVVSEAGDGISVLEQVDKIKPDVLFLDIEMPELTGIEVAKTLGVNGPLIVFVTAYDEFALLAFESNAIDYIVKPVNPKRFNFSIEKILKNVQNKKIANFEEFYKKLNKTNRPKRLAVKSGAKYEVFDPEKVSAVISKDHYSIIIVGNKELLSEDPLETVLQRLNQEVFLRVHRSAILNTSYLSELKREGDRKFIAKLSDEKQTEVPISRERLSGVKKFLGLS